MKYSGGKKRRFNKTILCLIILPLYVAITLAGIFAVIPAMPDFKIRHTESLNSNVVYVDNGIDIPYLYKADSEGNYLDEPFKILVFADTHIDSYIKRIKRSNYTIEMLRRNIEEQKPDLIIFAGDIVTAAFTKPRVKALAKMLEAYGVYWAPVYGNHDGEHFTTVSRKNLTKLWSSYSRCLVKDGGVTGSGNYFVNIMSAPDTLAKSLIFMDSGAYLTKVEKESFGFDPEEVVYDYIRPDQIEWYNNNIDLLKSTYGNDAKSMLFIHIALPEFDDAYNFGEVIYGEKREEVKGAVNSGMYDAIVAAGSTEAIFAGHDHINDYKAIYNGIRFVYCQSSGYSTYDLVSSRQADPSERLQGCTVLTIQTDGSYNIGRILNTVYEN